MPTPATSFEGSRVPGFTVEEFPTACINDPEKQCPFRLALVLQYVGDVQKDSDGSVPARALEDRSILELKLTEHTVNAGFIGCKDSTEATCAPREAMSSSPVRQTGVKVVREIMKILGIRGH